MIDNLSERKIRDVVAGAAHDVRREELPINQSNAWLESIQHYACPLWGKSVFLKSLLSLVRGRYGSSP